MGPIFFAFLFLRGGEQTWAYKPEWKRPNLNLSPHLTAPFAKRVCECTNTFSSFRQTGFGLQKCNKWPFSFGKRGERGEGENNIDRRENCIVGARKAKSIDWRRTSTLFWLKGEERRENIMRYNCKANSWMEIQQVYFVFLFEVECPPPLQLSSCQLAGDCLPKPTGCATGWHLFPGFSPPRRRRWQTDQQKEREGERWGAKFNSLYKKPTKEELNISKQTAKNWHNYENYRHV